MIRDAKNAAALSKPRHYEGAYRFDVARRENPRSV